MIPSSERVEALAHMLPARLSLSRPAMSLTQITMDEVPEGIPPGNPGCVRGLQLRRCGNDVVGTTWLWQRRSGAGPGAGSGGGGEAGGAGVPGMARGTSGGHSDATSSSPAATVRIRASALQPNAGPRGGFDCGTGVLIGLVSSRFGVVVFIWPQLWVRAQYRGAAPA